MANPILTLTTDFGLQDHYVGVMKGIILGVCPDARVVDISHSVQPYCVAEAAYLVAQSYPYFPAGTVHVAVVDPGVGTSRRAILAEAGGHRFLGPDNGILSLVFARERETVREVTNNAYFHHPVSRTFHGRDIFAPVAAALAAGAPADTMGPVIADYAIAEFAAPSRAGSTFRGRALHVDRFGNIVTNFAAAEFAGLMRGGFEMRVGSGQVFTLAENYEQCAEGEPFAIVGSSGFLEISVRQDSAANLLRCEAGAEILLELTEFRL